MKPNEINLSPTFLSKVYEKGYDYAVGEKLGLFPRKDTTAMSDGRLFHELIAEKLGGEKAKTVSSPYDNYRTKEARDWRDNQPDDVFIVSEERLNNLNQIADRAINHPKIKPLLEFPCATELMIEKPVNGFNIKGVLDVVSVVGEKKNVIDWKFVSSLVFDSFPKKALYMNYDLQASVYDYLTEATHVYFGVIENEAPHRIKLFWCDQSFLESGADKFNKAVTIIKNAKWRQPSFDILEVGELMDWNHYAG